MERENNFTSEKIFSKGEKKMSLIARILLKIINPFIWLINNLNCISHLEFYRNRPQDYEPYDFTKDIKYF